MHLLQNLRHLQILALSIIIFLLSKASVLLNIFSSNQKKATKTLNQVPAQPHASPNGFIYPLVLNSNSSQKVLYINYYENIMWTVKARSQDHSIYFQRMAVKRWQGVLWNRGGMKKNNNKRRFQLGHQKLKLLFKNCFCWFY